MVKKEKSRLSIYCLSENDPATYYRILQYIDYLSFDIIKIRYLSSNRIFKKYMNAREKNNYKIVIAILGYFRRLIQIFHDIFLFKPHSVFILRTIYPQKKLPLLSNLISKFIKSYSKNIIWDFDDDISIKEAPVYEFKQLEKYSNHIIVTNLFLKKTINVAYYHKLSYLSTTDASLLNFNIEYACNNRKREYPQVINLIWVGTHYSFNNLEEIINYLDEFSEKLFETNLKKVNLYIVSNVKCNFSTKSLEIINVNWSKETVASIYEIAHIGLMPLKETKFNLGKGSFKAIQYLGAGIPVVLSSVGNNINVVKDSENGFLYDSADILINSLIKLSIDIDLWEKMSINARCHWENNFNPINNSKVINNALLKKGN